MIPKKEGTKNPGRRHGRATKQKRFWHKEAAPGFKSGKNDTKGKYNLAAKALVGAHKNSVNKLRIIALGGLEEVGRNCILFEYDSDIIIVDMGLQFPEEDMPGIDYIIPDVTYLKNKINNIRGVIITHGHYDHIGGIPHLMKEIGNPVIYTAPLTAGIIKKRQEEYADAPKLNIYQINENSRLKLGGAFQVEFFRVNHTIPDSYGIVIKTPVGNIVHTGDFKFDKHPVNEKPIDINRLRSIGNQRVALLMADSTNAEHPGHQLSESDVDREMEKVFGSVQGRMIVGTFASNLSRVQLLISLAERHGRKVLVEGRSLNDNLDVSHSLGYMKFGKNTMVDWAEAKNIPDNKLMIICTGAQGERNAVLMRMANNEHKYLHIKKGDVVVFSSSVIPGNERTIQNLKDTLYRNGAKVIHYKMMDIHAGGHAKQEDLKELISLIRPKFYMPIYANHYMLRIHGELAVSTGIKESNVLIADNGQVVELTKDAAKVTAEKISAEYVFVDGLGVGDVSEIVLRDRRMMAEDGMLVVIVTIRKKTGELVQNPDLISRGFIYMKENKNIVEETRKRVRNLLKDKDHTSPAFEDYIKNKIRNEIGEFLWKRTNRRPMILPVLIEV
ncbi:MAG: ribonuclease J [Patescibacteria group bacterium]|jgi:ribonuclease J